jgi:hypothetical protein
MAIVCEGFLFGAVAVTKRTETPTFDRIELSESSLLPEMGGGAKPKHPHHVQHAHGINYVE